MSLPKQTLISISAVTVFTLSIAAGTLWWRMREKIPSPPLQALSQSQALSQPVLNLKPAPTFQLPDALGKTHTLEEFRGNTVLLHFWASWCAPCVTELPQWIELSTAFKNMPVRMIAVSLDQKWEDAQKILPSSKLSPNITSLLDISAQVPDLYGTYQFPETYLINPSLQIVTKWVGPQNWMGDEIQSLIRRQIQ